MYRKFCFVFIGLASVLFSLTGIFNFIVNPYDAWAIPRLLGVNVFSPKSDGMERIAKPIQFAQMNPKPQVVFLGASQVFWGMDMRAYNDIAGQSAYDFSMPSMTAYEARRYAEHILAVDANVEEIIIGVDFGMLVASDYGTVPQTMAGFDEDSIGKSWISASGVKQLLFSVRATKDSLMKIYDNHVYRWNKEFHLATGELSDEAVLYLLGQAHASFDYSIIQLQRQSRVKGAYVDEDNMAEIRRIVDMCRNHNVKLTLFIPPVHAQQMAVWGMVWDTYKLAMERLVQIHPVLDFTGYNTFTESSAKPGLVAIDTNPFFWDVLHPKKYLGKRMIQRMAGISDKEVPFGIWLTSENVEEQMESLRAGMKVWEMKHFDNLEKVVYYAGFSAVVPGKLYGKNMLERQGVVKLDQVSVARLFRLSLRPSDVLDITGVSFTSFGEAKTMYAMLEDEVGRRFYAMAEPLYDPSIALYMHSDAYNGCGFRVMERLWEVPTGRYTLYLLEVGQDGQVYQSDPLGKVKVELADPEAKLSSM